MQFRRSLDLSDDSTWTTSFDKTEHLSGPCFIFALVAWCMSGKVLGRIVGALGFVRTTSRLAIFCSIFSADLISSMPKLLPDVLDCCAQYCPVHRKRLQFTLTPRWLRNSETKKDMSSSTKVALQIFMAWSGPRRHGCFVLLGACANLCAQSSEADT